MKRGLIMSIDKFFEGVEVECKESSDTLPKDLWETYSAFANTKGGTIFLGVKEKSGNFSVSGVNNVDKVVKELWDNLNNNKKVSANIISDRDVTIENIDGKNIIKIVVPRADRRDKPIFIGENPYNDSKHSGTFRRNHSGDYKCNRQEIVRMIADSNDISQDSVVLEGFTIDDLNLESINSYKNRLESRNSSHPWLGLDLKNFLYKIGAYGKNRTNNTEGVTYAGLLMFGEEREICDEFPKYFLDYREKSSDSNLRWENRITSSDGLWSGNIFDFYFKVVNKLTSDLKVPFKLVDGVRKDDTELHEALREALANTLIHTDYRVERGIVVEKGENYFKFSNPGTLRISIGEALNGGISDPRNENIFKMFSLIGVGERAGSGIEKIQKAWKDENWISPQLDEKFDPDRIELTLKMEAMETNRKTNTLNNNTLKNDVSNTEDKSTSSRELFSKMFLDNFTDEEMKIIVLANFNGSVNNSGLQNFLGKKSKEVSNVLKSLVKRNILYSSGVGRGVEYRLTESVRNILDNEKLDFNEIESDSLDENQKLVVKFIRENGFVSTKLATEELGFSKRKAVSIFNSLVANGVVKRIGSGAYTRYVLVE